MADILSIEDHFTAISPAYNYPWDVDLPPALRSTYHSIMVRPKLRTHEGLLKSLKDKMEAIIQAPPQSKHAMADYFLATVEKHRNFILRWHLEYQKFMVENREVGSIRERDFWAAMNNSRAKCRRIVAGNVAFLPGRGRQRLLRAVECLHRDMTLPEGRPFLRVLDSLLFLNKVDAERERELWENSVYCYYTPDWQTKHEIWEPIFARYVRYGDMGTAHIVPYRIGCETMGCLFGGDGWEHMWGVGNGIPMEDHLQQSFGLHLFCLVPVEKDGGAFGLKVLLVDERLREYQSTGRGSGIEETFGGIDGRELKFQNDCRPSLPYLYLHYWVCMVKAKEENWPGWRELHERCEKGELWTMPGKYLRMSLLRKLVADSAFGEKLSLPERLFTDGDMDEEEEEAAVGTEARSVAAKELQAIFLDEWNFRERDDGGKFEHRTYER